MQIMKALVTLQVPSLHAGVANVPWGNHPATKMWMGYEWALMSYQTVMCNEWTSRGYNDTCLEKTQLLFNHFGMMPPEMPPWLGQKRFHTMHRANLLRKDPEFYGKFNWPEEPAEGYFWPRPKKII